MANRLKEEEKNERIIRGLLKLPANRRCINCNNLGPQYVCTNFWTFICTNCSGVHREFTHRVKSVSMAKFTSQEVTALQEGGNECAREIYFKEWDPQRNSYPDSSNIDRLRDFIKQVYVNGRFTGGKNPDRVQRTNGADREDYPENRRTEPYRGGSSSPPYEARYNERPTSGSRNDDQSVRSNFGERSPGYSQGDSKKSPARFEVVDDRHRDDRFGNGSQNRKLEGNRSTDVPKPEMRSPDQQKKISLRSPPMVRPLRDILGDDVPKLQVGDPLKTNGTKLPDNSAQTKIISPSSSMSSSDGNTAQFKSTGSLIDFSEPEPAVVAAPQQNVSEQTTPVSANDGDWASFDVFTQPEVPQAAANANPLESALAELSAPVPPPASNAPYFLASNSSQVASSVGKVQVIQQQMPSMLPGSNDLYSNHPSNASTVGTSNNQSMLLQTSQPQVPLPGQAVGLAGNLPRITTKLPQGLTEGLHSQPSSADGVCSQPSSAESKSSGRKELPADIFTSLYPPAPMPNPGWQRGPYPVMGYGMQYPVGMAMPIVPQSLKTVNPFDINGDSVPQFPSMASLQGALPNMNTQAALQRSSSFGIPSQQWAPPQQFSHPPAASPSPYMVQQVPSSMPQHMHVPNNIHQQMQVPSNMHQQMQVPSNMHQQMHVPNNIPQQMHVPSNIPQQLPPNMMQMGHPGLVGLGSDGAALGTSGMEQNSAARFSLPNTPNSFAPVGGNPFR